VNETVKIVLVLAALMAGVVIYTWGTLAIADGYRAKGSVALMLLIGITGAVGSFAAIWT
jgi:hypothetical protein